LSNRMMARVVPSGMARVVPSGLAFCTLFALGCSITEPPADGETSVPVDGQPARAATEVNGASLPNLLRITGSVYCGGAPRGEASFVDLARLGVKTVVSVDGARPDVVSARKHGLRYVHIPIGYDGIEKRAELSLLRLVHDAKRPFYIHCHHGRHRGPVAAAVACVAAGEIDRRGALKVLERAGTSRNYGGLWRAVETFRLPAADAWLPQLVEVAEVDSLAAGMAGIDRAYSDLMLCRDFDWATPANHPDLVPRQQALLLKEGFRESRRNLAGNVSREMESWLTEAQRLCEHVEDALAVHDTDAAARSFQLLGQACNRCHERYRD